MDVYGYCLRSFLTACPKEIVVLLPLAVRKPNLNCPYRLAALAVWRAQLQLTDLPEAVTINIPGLPSV